MFWFGGGTALSHGGPNWAKNENSLKTLKSGFILCETSFLVNINTFPICDNLKKIEKNFLKKILSKKVFVELGVETRFIVVNGRRLRHYTTEVNIWTKKSLTYLQSVKLTNANNFLWYFPFFEILGSKCAQQYIQNFPQRVLSFFDKIKKFSFWNCQKSCLFSVSFT